MRYYKYITLIVLSISFTSCEAQTQDLEAITNILNKLKEVEESKFLNPDTAYVIDSDKSSISYSKFKDKWLLVDFWSTGCAPCIKEFPTIAKFYTNNKDSIDVIAISVDKEFERYKKSAKRYKIGVPHYFAGYTYKNQIFNLNIKAFKTDKGTYKFSTMTPQYVLIDPNGKVVDKDFPKPSSPDFKVKLQQAINEYE